MPDLNVWPTDGADGSVSSEVRWRKMARLWTPSGVAFGLAPALIAGPAISVQPGAGWLDGHYAELPAAANITASANGLLVLRFTPADNRCELLYRDGVTTPTQTDPTWELPIAQMVAGALIDRRGAFVSGWSNQIVNVASNAGAAIAATGAGPPYTALPNSTLQLPAGLWFLQAIFDINVVTAAGGNIARGIIYLPTTVAGNSILNYAALLDMNTVQRASVPGQAFAFLTAGAPVQLGGIKNTAAGVVNMETPSVLTAIRYG